MKKIKYIISRIIHMDFSNMFISINRVKVISGQNKIKTFFDMIFCAFKYGTGYTDYLSFGFYDLNRKQRLTYLTRGQNNKFVAMLNKKEAMKIFDYKSEFNKAYSKFLKRDWIFLDNNREEFDKFIEGKKEVIAKPNNAMGGSGIEKIIVSDYQNNDELYNYLISKDIRLVEEILVQHEYLSSVHPHSVNTIRVITVVSNNKVNFITAFLRIGNGKFVDNTCSGGMLTMIDINSGKTLYAACDGALNVYENHPITNVKLSDIEIPKWDLVIKTVEEIALINKDVKYIGWDVAVLNDGVAIIEGNPYPGYYYQFPIHCKDKTGALPTFEKILKN